MATMFDPSPGFHMAGLPEREQVIGYLERGTAVQKFCAKTKPERKTMLVRRELMLHRRHHHHNHHQHRQ